MTNDLMQIMNRQLANWTVLYEKLHNYHWFIKGQHFFTLHEKFEELYDEANGYIDEIAERMLAIGGTPIATLSECLKLATVAEATGQENEQQMVQSIIADFEKISDELQQGIGIAEEAGDDGTADMFIGTKQALSKHLWMLNAYLG